MAKKVTMDNALSYCKNYLLHQNKRNKDYVVRAQDLRYCFNKMLTEGVLNQWNGDPLHTIDRLEAQDWLDNGKYNKRIKTLKGLPSQFEKTLKIK